MSEETKDARKKDLGGGKIQNAEEFANYVHAVSIPMKVVMAAIVVFFAGVIAFCVFGRVPVTINIAAVADDAGTCTCYVKADDRNDIEPGDTVEIGGASYTVVDVSVSATCVDETFDEYACDVGELTEGDYVFFITVDGNLTRGVYSATLIKGYLKPLSVLLAS